MTKLAALVLAAGKGTRMRSTKPKVLQELLGSPMLAYVYAALEPVCAEKIWTVIGHKAELVKAAFPAGQWILQLEQLGTGDALSLAMPVLENAGMEKALVVNGDTPLLSSEFISDFLERAQNADLAFASITLADPGGYGRVIRNGAQVLAILEAKDDPTNYSPDCPPTEVNAGIYLFRLEAIKPLLPRLKNSNKSGEYYITDLIGLGADAGLAVEAVPCGEDASLMGINSPRELVSMEELLRQRTVQALLSKDVLLHAPELARISPFALIAPGAEISGPCEIFGHCVIEPEARVDAFCSVRDTRVMRGAHIRSFSHLEGAELGIDSIVGPYTRLRSGAILEENAHAGNFVELKKARLGQGAKANHLSYLGDAEIGAGCNIGAGTITCNYDGKHKYKTKIGARAFIGSNSSLVAPVSIGEDALVGAGSVVTKNVPDGEMAIARGRQKNLPRKPSGASENKA